MNMKEKEEKPEANQFFYNLLQTEACIYNFPIFSISSLTKQLISAAQIQNSLFHKNNTKMNDFILFHKSI